MGRWLATWALLLGACAEAEPDDGPRFRPPPDALVGGMGDAGVPGAVANRLLFFQVGADGYLSSAAGTDPRLICENARPVPDAVGGRVLCVPDSDDDPLSLYDVANDLELVQFADWRQSNLGPPLIAPDGSRVAVKATNDQLQDVVRVFDDNGVQVGEVEAFELLGFARDDVLIVDLNQPAVWRIGDEPVIVSGGNATPVGPDPAGMVYELPPPDSKVFFHDADTGRARELAVGTLAGAFDDRILVLQDDPDLPGSKRALLLDLDDSAYEAYIPVPNVPFDRVLELRLTGRTTVIIEVQTFVTCGAMQQRVATRTTWYDTLRDEIFEIDDTGGEAHRAFVGRRGERALILDVDACGNPAGSGRIKNLRTGDVVRLQEFVQGAISAAVLSPDGRFVAVAQADGVTVVDLASEPPLARMAGGGAPGGTEFQFR